MLKKVLALLFACVLLLSFAACGPAGEDPQNPDPGSAGTDSAAGTDASSGSESDKDEDKEEKPILYDEDMEHKFLATDITNHSIVLYDLNLANGVYENLKGDSCIVWEWDADEDPNCKINPGKGIDAAKYRYSPYYEKDVIIACSSGGGAYVIDFEEKTVLWEYNIGTGPHSIEMMPNGDVVVACSGGATEGKVAYVPLSTGETKPSSTIHSPSGHGVMYDPENECLWVLEFEQIYSCIVKNYGTKNATLVRVTGSGYDFGRNKQDTSGHVLSPVYGQPGKYWVAGGKLWMFDSTTEEFTRSYSHAATYSAKAADWMKGVAYFPDGTMIQTVPGSGGKTTTDWACGGFRITTLEMSEGKVKTVKANVSEVLWEPSDREWYKVHTFCKDYQ